jgi:HD-GYP domain-containing protein (c-di-GMP phosphodiesterase class II)
MRYISVDRIKDDMILGKELVGDNCQLLLKRGAKLSEKYIDKIKDLGYIGVYIEDKVSQGIEVEDVVDEKLRNKGVLLLEKTFKEVAKDKGISDETVENINDVVNGIIDCILANKNAIVNLMDLKVYDEYTYYHSINVCVLAVIIGVALELKRENLFKLGLASIYHDIGKMFVPVKIINKPGKLTPEEFDIVKTHPRHGYEFLKNKQTIPMNSYVGVLHHHEKYDGTGYPGFVEGKRINIYGRIVSIVDAFDALTSKRPYADAIPIFEAVEYVQGNGGVAFDPELINIFLRKIAHYPVGTTVSLSDNTSAIVMENYEDCPLRPKVKVYKEFFKEIEPYEVDLKTDEAFRNVTIINK